ncbi:Tetratricopeptide repeat-containing protein [Reichenbachiella agariperforans]|uniref:Tetratricopeptide repeat-containing protein n=1 Tax=Reichenbachiella agariperforans TaxID=156994 RepID=A0A1M6KNW3_REIAG|nr:Tetratricopeptide repeat-containing protein [Reichenbachiella agariperforans]
MSYTVGNIKKYKVSRTHLFLFLLSLTFLSLDSHAQKSIDSYPRVYSAYQDILKLKIESGRKKLKQIIPSHEELGHYHYTKSLADALEILITEDPDLYNRYDDSEEDHLDGLKALDGDDPYKRFYSAEIKVHWALVKTMFQEEMRAGWALRSAYLEINDNIEQFPDFVHNNKTLGTLHVLFAVVPESYHWILRYFGLRANVIEGWEELSNITFQNPYWLETSLSKCLIAINIINKEKVTMDLIDEIRRHNKDNLAVSYLYNVALVKYAKSEEALPALTKLTFVGDSYYPITNIYYKLGEIYLQKQQYALARLNYARFLNMHKGENYIKDTWFKIFLTYWLEGQKKNAELHWDKAKKAGRSLVAADKNATDYLSNDRYPNPELYKARLAIDGGYFSMAQRTLDRIKQESIKNKKDEVEYFYRYGRLYDKQGDSEGALFNYLNVIKKSGNENWYFAPSACLQTGYIYEARADYEKAKYYFKKAQSYNKHKYKDGIDYQAKAALLLIQDKK